MLTQIDHIVLAAHTLEQGVDYLETLLGVRLPFGGVHCAMGTHNHLMQLSDHCFFEIIAINPASNTNPALKIDRPRWFDLDNPSLQQALIQQPRLLTWVVNSDDILSFMAQETYRDTELINVKRGNLNWQFTLPQNGCLLDTGVLPYALQWQSDSHPALLMQNLGIKLRALEVHHPDADSYTQQLKCIGADELVTVISLLPHEKAYFNVTLVNDAGQETVLSSLTYDS